MPTIYPPAPATLTGDVESINRFLTTPSVIRRALRSILQDRFISDFLLSRTIPTAGGAVLFETQGESIYAERNPQMVAPLGEYPLTGVPTGPASLAQVKKWGLDSPVSDESITWRLMDPVQQALLKITNSLVRTIDGVAMSAIATAVTQTVAAAAPWASASATQMFQDVGRARLAIINQNNGYDPDTVVSTDAQWLAMQSKFIDAGYLPREAAGNPIAQGTFVMVNGMRYVTTPNIPVANAVFVLDSAQLGGMADADLAGPGYSGRIKGVDGKAIRSEENDGWRLRARRLTVPVVTDPNAACTITGVGAGIVS